MGFDTSKLLGDFIRDEIKASGKRQVEIARALNIPPATVNKWVRTGQISRDNMAALSKVLKKDLIQAAHKLSDQVPESYSNYTKWVQIIAYHVAAIQHESAQLPARISSKWIAQCFDRFKNKSIPAKPFDNPKLVHEIKKMLKQM